MMMFAVNTKQTEVRVDTIMHAGSTPSLYGYGKLMPVARQQNNVPTNLLAYRCMITRYMH